VDEQNGKYGCLIHITDQGHIDTIESLVGDVAEDAFRTRVLGAGYNNPVRDSNEKKPDGSFSFSHPKFRTPGIVIRAKTQFPVEGFWGANRIKCDSPGDIQGGDECLIVISAFSYNNQSKGVGLSLGPVWRLRKGDARVERGAGQVAAVKVDRAKLRFDDEELA
jgi:hypothetical protein